jgi:hypothetical protein
MVSQEMMGEDFIGYMEEVAKQQIEEQEFLNVLARHEVTCLPCNDCLCQILWSRVHLMFWSIFPSVLGYLKYNDIFSNHGNKHTNVAVIIITTNNVKHFV